MLYYLLYPRVLNAFNVLARNVGDGENVCGVDHSGENVWKRLTKLIMV